MPAFDVAPSMSLASVPLSRQPVIRRQWAAAFTFDADAKLTVVPPSEPVARLAKQASPTVTCEFVIAVHPVGVVMPRAPGLAMMTSSRSPALTVAGIETLCVVAAVPKAVAVRD